MIHLDISTIIYRPIRQVFDFVSTPENDFQWQYGTLATASLSGDVSKKGTAFRSVGHLMGHRIQGTFQVIDYEPNRKYGFKSLSGPLHSQTSYTFEIANGGTRITMSVRARMVDFFQMDEHLLGMKIKKQLKENLSLLKGILEKTVSTPETFPITD
jgi:uncharacterized protein YndB with AHSA1/START domain